MQIETPSETSTERINHQPLLVNQFFGSINRPNPLLLDNDASKAKSSLIKRGSLALRQPPQQQHTKLDNVNFISNENSNMLFNSREPYVSPDFNNK